MARSAWVHFGVVLVVVVSAAMMGTATVGEEEERVADDGAGDVRGKGHGARSAETGGAGMEAASVGDRGVACGARLEEGEASGIGGGEDSTFQDLSKLSSGSHPSKLRQGTIFEIFEAKRGHRRQSDELTSMLAVEEEELGSDDDDDDDFDMEAEASGEEEMRRSRRSGLRSRRLGLRSRPGLPRDEEEEDP